MPVSNRGQSTGIEEIDRWSDGVGWLAHPDEVGERASHAIKGDDGVWVIDPVDGPGVDTLIEELGDVVGVAVLSSHARSASVPAEVTAVYVLPSVAREGVGTRIYSELERRARTHGIETLGLSASLNAVPFYEAQGYERVREYEHEFSSHVETGVTGRIVEMKKHL